MRRCTKLASSLGCSTTNPLLCSLCDSSFARSVSSSTIILGHCTTKPSVRKSDVFPSLWRRSPFGLEPQQIQNNAKRSYSANNNKNMETGMVESTSSEGNIHNLKFSSGDCRAETSCSTTSPSSSKMLFANNHVGNCGGGNNHDSNRYNNGASSMLLSKSPAVTLGNTSPTTFTPVRTVVTSQRLVEISRDSIMEQPKLMSKEEREEFMSVYHSIVKELLEIPDMKDMEETNRWMGRVLQYNVPHGKRNRGLITALSYKYFAPEELTNENIRLSYILGWCVEILQAYFLVSDDIMDESETRRGRPCWYKVDNLGLAAINDAIMLESVIYQILRKHFGGKPCYPKLMEVMHDITYKTIFGQSLDTRTGQDRRMETYTMERYSSIVKYKTSYYSFYLPVALAMTLCDIKDPKLYQQVKKVTLEMGHFFQVQDDFLDCFGDVQITGKIGTDIQDCKCSWLFLVAVERCNPEQKKFLLANYGVNEPAKIEAVTGLYKDLGLEEVYHNYEEQTYNLICTHVQQMNEELPKGLFYDMLHKIYKRSS